MNKESGKGNAWTVHFSSTMRAAGSEKAPPLKKTPVKTKVKPAHRSGTPGTVLQSQLTWKAVLQLLLLCKLNFDYRRPIFWARDVMTDWNRLPQHTCTARVSVSLLWSCRRLPSISGGAIFFVLHLSSLFFLRGQLMLMLSGLFQSQTFWGGGLVPVSVAKGTQVIGIVLQQIHACSVHVMKGHGQIRAALRALRQRETGNGPHSEEQMGHVCKNKMCQTLELWWSIYVLKSNQTLQSVFVTLTLL